MGLVDAGAVAEPFYASIRRDVAGLGVDVRLVGILGNHDRASQVYSGYAARGCEKVGILYEQRVVAPEDVSAEIFKANEDPAVHGVLVYYPIFGGVRDRSLQNEIAIEKDVEGLHSRWTHRLYHDVRFVDPERNKKAVLPCTPLGIMKALRHLGLIKKTKDPRESARGLVITIFNRSEVVGRPLAAMLAHDGARVYSFDIDGVQLYTGRDEQPIDIDRAQALAESDVVITGVPKRSFQKVTADEIKAGATCVNFSHFNNLADGLEAKAAHILPRVGPITVAMLLRNTVRLYRNFHSQ